MNFQTKYLEIHEKAYERLRLDGRSSWSEIEDLAERIHFYQEVISQFELKPGAKILVIGCGDGETSLYLQSAGYVVTGLDISPTAIQWAKEKAQERGINATFIEANIISDINKLENFDAVVDDHCLHCIIGQDRKSALENVYELLNSKGIFILRTHCGDPPKNAPLDFFKMWDPTSRCQVFNGIAGRYFGLYESILEELETALLSVNRYRTFIQSDGWGMLEAVFVKK